MFQEQTATISQQAAEIASLKDRIDELEHYRQEAHEALECVTEDRTEQAAEIERLRAEKAKLVEALTKIARERHDFHFCGCHLHARAALASVADPPK